jgi:hypothetical protein
MVIFRKLNLQSKLNFPICSRESKFFLLINNIFYDVDFACFARTTSQACKAKLTNPLFSLLNKPFLPTWLIKTQVIGCDRFPFLPSGKTHNPLTPTQKTIKSRENRVCI